jgi:predicted ArsR family transcriptional regulator
MTTVVGFNRFMDRAAVAAIAALEDDVRRALYEFVRGAGGPVTRESAAEAVGISRNLAAFHLDKLVQLGLLRSGFGDGERRVGRAPRIYEPATAEISVRVPERAPEVLADILMSAVLDERPDEPARTAAQRIARDRGVGVGALERARLRAGRIGVERARAASVELLAARGYEPYRCAGAVRLRNCPFLAQAAAAPEFVCGLNRAYLSGVVEGLGGQHRLTAVLVPRAGECCVELQPRR